MLRGVIRNTIKNGEDNLDEIIGNLNIDENEELKYAITKVWHALHDKIRREVDAEQETLIKQTLSDLESGKIDDSKAENILGSGEGKKRLEKYIDKREVQKVIEQVVDIQSRDEIRNELTENRQDIFDQHFAEEYYNELITKIRGEVMSGSTDINMTVEEQWLTDHGLTDKIPQLRNEYAIMIKGTDILPKSIREELHKREDGEYIKLGELQVVIEDIQSFKDLPEPKQAQLKIKLENLKERTGAKGRLAELSESDARLAAEIAEKESLRESWVAFKLYAQKYLPVIMIGMGLGLIGGWPISGLAGAVTTGGSLLFEKAVGTINLVKQQKINALKTAVEQLKIKAADANDSLQDEVNTAINKYVDLIAEVVGIDIGIDKDKLRQELLHLVGGAGNALQVEGSMA